MALVLPRLVHRVRGALARFGPDDARDVDVFARVNDALLLRGRRIDQHDRDLVAADVRRDVELVVVRGEELRRELIAKSGLEHGLELRLGVRALDDEAAFDVEKRPLQLGVAERPRGALLEG